MKKTLFVVSQIPPTPPAPTFESDLPPPVGFSTCAAAAGASFHHVPLPPHPQKGPLSSSSQLQQQQQQQQQQHQRQHQQQQQQLHPAPQLPRLITRRKLIGSHDAHRHHVRTEEQLLPPTGTLHNDDDGLFDCYDEEGDARLGNGIASVNPTAPFSAPVSATGMPSLSTSSSSSTFVTAISPLKRPREEADERIVVSNGTHRTEQMRQAVDGLHSRHETLLPTPSDPPSIQQQQQHYYYQHPHPQDPQQYPSHNPVVESVPPSMAHSRLDEFQKECAFLSGDRGLLILAGAGSGKTQTVASRIAFLLTDEGVDPERIVGITFSRQAAQELRNRVLALVPSSYRNHVKWIKLRTFHSFCLELCRKYIPELANKVVVDVRQQKKIAEAVVGQYAETQRSSEVVKGLLKYVEKRKRTVPKIGVLEPVETNPQHQIPYLYTFYQNQLHTVEGALDFGDMHYELCLRLQKNDPIPSLHNQTLAEHLRSLYTHLVVDEFQDVNSIQLEILRYLAGPNCRVTCVGDPNQSIYEWRGATANIFSQWHRLFPQTALRFLGNNYRSSVEIVDTASSRSFMRDIDRLSGLAGHGSTPAAASVGGAIAAPPPPPTTTTTQERRGNDVFRQKSVMGRIGIPVFLQPFGNNSYLHLGLIDIIKTLRTMNERLSYADIAILVRTRKRLTVAKNTLQTARIPCRSLLRKDPTASAYVDAFVSILQLFLNPHSPLHCKNVLNFYNKTLKRLPAGIIRDVTAEVSHAAVLHNQQKQQQQQLPSPASQQQPVSCFTVLESLVVNGFVDPRSKITVRMQRHKDCLREFVEMVREGHRMVHSPHFVAELPATSPHPHSEESTGIVEGGGSVLPSSAFAAEQEGGGEGTQSSFISVMDVLRFCFSASGIMKYAAEEVEQRSNEREKNAATAAKKATTNPRRVYGDEEEEDDDLDEESADLIAASSVLTFFSDAVANVLCSQRLSQAGHPHNNHRPTQQTAAHPSQPPPPPSQVRSHSAMRIPGIPILREVLDEMLLLCAKDNYGDVTTHTGGGGDATASTRGLAPPSRPSSITLTTVHQAKGLEWPVVILFEVNDGHLPMVYDDGSRVDQEEFRIFYVAMTRAQRVLVVTYALDQPSRFVELLKKDAPAECLGTLSLEKAAQQQ